MAVGDWPLLRWRMREYATAVGAPRSSEEPPGWPRTSSTLSPNWGPATAGQIEAHLAEGPRLAEGPMVGPQRHQSGWPRRCGHRGADHGPPDEFRPALRPRPSGCCHGRMCWPARSTDAGPLRELTLRAGRPRWVGTGPISGTTSVGPRRGAAGAGGVGRRREPGTRRGGRLVGPGPAYLRAGQIAARRTRHRALCPFDPLIFFRPRVERSTTGCSIRTGIEIHTPAAKRRYGCSRRVAPSCWTAGIRRVDLKADRAADVLIWMSVGAFAVGRARREPARTAGATRLRSIADDGDRWLGMGSGQRRRSRRRSVIEPAPLPPGIELKRGAGPTDATGDAVRPSTDGP